MRISKTLWVEDGIKWTAWKRNRLVQKNKYRGRDYLICSSPCKHWLFEVIEAGDLSKRYETCYLLGIAQTKEVATTYVTKLVDDIYNKQLMSYESLIT